MLRDLSASQTERLVQLERVQDGRAALVGGLQRELEQKVGGQDAREGLVHTTNLRAVTEL